ncbi:hypothetical protein [Rhodococcus gannanensis]|uniref:PH domain-containing protein n=1 Tax=Rhodococcus gannanensis TaxID=1960308 RepID=A0ABW4P1N8_9NOCA
MRSSEERLARPLEWPAHARDPKFVTSVIGLSVIVVVSGFMTAGSALTEGFSAATRYTALFCVLMVLTVVFGFVHRRQSRGDVDVQTVSHGGSAVTRIRYSAQVLGLISALMVALALFCGGGAVEIYLNTDGFPGASIIFGAIGAFCAAFLIALVAGRVQRGALLLSPEGIRQRGWSFESYLPWSSVAGVVAVHHGFPQTLVIGYSNAEWDRRYTTRLFRIDRLPNSPLIEIDTRQFACDPVLLHHLVAFYVDNPAARCELGTEVALARIRARDYQPTKQSG